MGLFFAGVHRSVSSGVSRFVSASSLFLITIRDLEVRSVDSQQLELNHMRIKITKHVVNMNPYASHADSDSCRAVSPRKPNLRDSVHSVGRAGGASTAWLLWNGGADHVSPTNLTSRWTACLH